MDPLGTALGVSPALKLFPQAAAAAGPVTPAASVAAPPQSQASRQPDQSAARSAGARMAGGTSSTMLTGPGGVQPNLLNIGKNTLLGG